MIKAFLSALVLLCASLISIGGCMQLPDLPEHAYRYGATTWTCYSGYTKVGTSCVYDGQLPTPVARAALSVLPEHAQMKPGAITGLLLLRHDGLESNRR